MSKWVSIGAKEFDMRNLGLILVLTAVIILTGNETKMEALDLVNMKIVNVKTPTAEDFNKYRKILVSPTVNTPKPFKGFGGFCGWPKVCLLQNGDLYVTFSAGYWHASWPTP